MDIYYKPSDLRSFMGPGTTNFELPDALGLDCYSRYPEISYPNTLSPP